MSFPSGSHQSDADLIPTYTVCIVGDPRSGKSCFCNRFVYSHRDWYQEDHPSVLTETNFCGPVVNSDHWLYWGTVTRRLDDDTSVRFCVIEQTEFLSGTTSLPFNPSLSSYSAATYASSTSSSAFTNSSSSSSLHSSSHLHDYILRSTAMKLYSPGKLRYYCIDQLGHEDRYKQEVFPYSGPLEVHGFLVIYDVSRRAGHNVPDLQQQQLAFLIDVLTLISKRKKPVVVVASKRDIVDEQCLSSVIQFLQKSADFRKIPIVESSAHRNINVELAFLTLARLLENIGTSNKSRSSKLRLQSYQEATREQDEYQRRLREAFVNRVSLSPASFLTDWPTFLGRYSHQGDVARFMEIWGSDVAKETFEQFTAQWKTEKKRRHMAKLPEVLSIMLLYVGPITNQSPKELLQRLRAHSQFDHFFISEDSSDDNFVHRSSFQDGDDKRIPFSLALKEPPDNGDSPFMESIKSLVAAETWASNMSIFENALLQWQNSSSILAGQPFDHDQLVRINPTTVLSQDDQLEVYQKFQECLRLYTREEFLDLLLESLPHFIRAASAYLNCLGDSFFTLTPSNSYTNPPHQPRSEPNRSRPISPASEPPNIPLRAIQLPAADIRLCAVLAPPRGAKEQQLNMINTIIFGDPRYRAMDYMPSERQTCLTSHLDILLHRRNFQNEASASPLTTIQRHNSCSFMDQQDASLQLTFPLPHCPAYQTGRCMDLVFENLCSSAGWSVGETPNTFSSHLSSVLGQGNKRLCVAVCAICTDVIAATAGINLFRAAGFVPEGVTSPSLLTNVSSVSKVTQNLVSSWPLASTLLTPVDILIASINGDSLISPVLGTVQASFLSHHELLTLATNPRQSPDVFDGVIFLISTDENQPCTPSCICGKASYCCKCCRGATDCSHNTPRPRSFYSRATAIKALVEHLAPMPYLVVLAGEREDCITLVEDPKLPSFPESSPKTPIAGNSNLISDGERAFFENCDEKSKSTSQMMNPQTGFALDSLSAFLSSCWTRKLTSTESVRRRKASSSQKNASPKARDSADGSCSTIHEGCLRSALSPGRLHANHHRRCCHRHYYHHRHHHYHHHHVHRHHHHYHNSHQHFHHCSRPMAAMTAATGCSIYTASRASSSSSLMGGSNLRLPKLTLTPAEIAPSMGRRPKFARSFSFPLVSIKRSLFCDLEPLGLGRQKSRSLYYRKTTYTQPYQPTSSKLDGSPVFRLDDFDDAKSPNGLLTYRLGLPSTLDPPTGYCSSLVSSCSPCPGGPASYTSLLSSAPSPTPTSPPSDSVFLRFAEGISPLPPVDVDPSTPPHVMPLEAPRRWRPKVRGLALLGNEVEATQMGEAEIFHTTDDALHVGMVHLVPCPHLLKIVESERSAHIHLPQGQLVKPHSIGQKSLDLGLGSKVNHHQLRSHGHNLQTTAATAAGGGSVSSFLTSGIRAVTSGFVRPRERRRSVSTPCGNEAPGVSFSGNANHVIGCGGGVGNAITSASNTPSSSTPGSARATDFVSICALPGPGTPQRIGGGYSTDTTSKASTPPYVIDEVDSICAGNSAPTGESFSSCLQVSTLSQMMQIATRNSLSQDKKNSETANVSQPRHWHLPTCPHRLCIPRQNLPPPPPSALSSLATSARRHVNNNYTGGSHVPTTNTGTLLEDYSSFRSSYNQHQYHQPESIAAQPPESRHLPVTSATEHSRLPRQQQQLQGLQPASLSAFQGDLRSALDLPSCLEATSTAPTGITSRSTTCLLANTTSPRLSPPPTLIPSITTATRSSVSVSSGRKNKRNMLSLFGGRANTSLSSDHFHHQQSQHAGSHNAAVATVAGSGGASFPSTPVHEAPAIVGIATATTSAHAKSATPPLATFATSNSSSGGSSVPATNSNGWRLHREN